MRLVHVVLSSLMLSLGIGCMVAAGPSGGSESEGAGDVATETAAGEELVGESGEAIAIGVKCGDKICGRGTYCCNASCGICAPKGGACTQQVCEPVVEEPIFGQRCGQNVCGAGEFCCNPSCGICAPEGGACTQQMCEPVVVGPIIGGQKCGQNTCGKGEFCCNASCGICAPKGGACTQQVCAALE